MSECGFFHLFLLRLTSSMPFSILRLPFPGSLQETTYVPKNIGLP
jgi:hypothetical protein